MPYRRQYCTAATLVEAKKTSKNRGSSMKMACAAVLHRHSALRYALTRPTLREFNSASSGREPLPPIGAWAYFKRMIERRSIYENNKAASVFSPNMSGIKTWLLFGVVQLPQDTVLDLPEFLDGTKLAVASVLQTTSSKDFTHFVVGKSPDSESARLLREWCTPMGYEALVDNVRHSWGKQRMFEIESVDIERVFLIMARYDRVSEAQLAEDGKLAQQVLMERKWSADATIERLQLNVGFIATERTKQTLLPEKRVRLVDSKWYYQAALVSNVTTPEEIDWRIAAVVAERGLGETLISEEIMAADDDHHHGAGEEEIRAGETAPVEDSSETQNEKDQPAA